PRADRQAERRRHPRHQRERRRVRQRQRRRRRRRRQRRLSARRAARAVGCLPIAGTDLVLSWHVERTAHYGPLVARGTLENGTPIAIATLRTTYQNEL